MFSHSTPTLRSTARTISAALAAGACAFAVNTNAHAATKSGASHAIHATHAGTAAYIGANSGHRPHVGGRYYNGYRPYYGYRNGWGGSYYRAGWYAGLFVPFLPFGYATYWHGAAPYYYYDDVYYVSDRGGYDLLPFVDEAKWGLSTN